MRMKSSFAFVLQIVVVLVGIMVLAFLLWEPHLEGRNSQATPFEIYFHDPFLAYVYLGSFPFFVGTYRAFALLGQARANQTVSQATVNGLRAIKRCAISILGFVALGIVFILIFGDKEDRPAGIFMSLLVTLASSITAFAAALFARNVQNALRRSEGSRN